MTQSWRTLNLSKPSTTKGGFTQPSVTLAQSNLNYKHKKRHSAGCLLSVSTKQRAYQKQKELILLDSHARPRPVELALTASRSLPILITGAYGSYTADSGRYYLRCRLGLFAFTIKGQICGQARERNGLCVLPCFGGTGNGAFQAVQITHEHFTLTIPPPCAHRRGSRTAPNRS
jgi:hypothetical protein